MLDKMLEDGTKYATQRNATQRNATQLAKLHLKFLPLSFLTTISLLLPTVSFAETTNIQNELNISTQILQLPKLSAKENYGCEAFLCFAGGLHEPACQKTIARVKRDLIRGRGFPHCPMVANADGSFGGNGSPLIWTEKSKRRVYVYVQDVDGAVRQVANLRRRR